MPGRAELIARGGMLPAGQLLQVQSLGVSVWWWLSFIALLLNFPVLGVTAALRPDPEGRSVAADIMLVLIGMMAVAVGQAGMLWFRSNRTRAFVYRHLLEAANNSLPEGSLGLPRQTDFWLMLFVMIAFFVTLLYASGML